MNHLRGVLTILVKRLFEPFYRNPSDADKVAGSGLGLAIVKELTEKLGGTISSNLEAHRLEITIEFAVREEGSG